MAKKEETVADRVDHVKRSLMRSSGAIRAEVERLAELEKYLKRDETVISLFRLHLKTIVMEADNIAAGEIERG